MWCLNLLADVHAVSEPLCLIWLFLFICTQLFFWMSSKLPLIGNLLFIIMNFTYGNDMSHQFTEWHDGCYMWSKSCVPFRSTWVHPGMWLRTYCSSLFFCVYFSFLLSHVSIGVFFNHVLFSSVIPNCFNVYKLLSFFFFLLLKRYELSQSSKIPYDWVIVPYTKWAIFQEDEVDVYQCLLTETGNW